MISSIFGKTKPINYIIVLTFLFIFYWPVHFFLFNRVYSPEQLLLQGFALGILLFSIFIVNFIAVRNKVTGTNSFAILFYALLIVVFPETILDNNIIFCSFFLLLATRRLISIKSLRNIKFKIFDASLWIMVSSLFYDWAILYLLLVFAAIYIYEPKNVRNWMVPLAGVITGFMITYCILILANNKNFLTAHYQFSFDSNVVFSLDWGNGPKLVIYVLITFLAAFFAFLKLGKTGLGKIVTMRLVALSFILGIVVKVLTSSEEVHPIMVTFFPAVIFITNYIESIKREKLREFVLIFSIFIPLIVFITTFVLR